MGLHRGTWVAKKLHGPPVNSLRSSATAVLFTPDDDTDSCHSFARHPASASADAMESSRKHVVDHEFFGRSCVGFVTIDDNDPTH